MSNCRVLGILHLELAAARDQAALDFDALPERDRPRYQLLCDFQDDRAAGGGRGSICRR